MWFKWKLEHYVKSGKRHTWKTVEERASTAPFWVVDGTGGVLVRPRDAEVDVPMAVRWRADESALWASHRDLRMESLRGEDPEERARSMASAPPPDAASTTPIAQLGRSYRISEWHIEPGQELYVLGTAMLRQDAGGLEVANHHGPEGLLISGRSESDVARASRRRAVVGLLLGLVAAVLVPAVFRLLSVEDPPPELVAGLEIGPSADDDPMDNLPIVAFVAVGLWSYYRLLRSPQASLWEACFSFAVMALWPLWQSRFHYEYLADGSRSLWEVAGPWMALGGGVYLSFLAALYWVRVYNRLVAVKQQAAAAWSLIDVALRRRHDLLPNLAAVAAEHAAHEREVVETVAGLRLDERLRLSETLPGDASLRSAADLDRREAQGARTLVTLSEDSPTLAADEAFQDLARRITEVEDQVAFARRFYNDAVTVLRDRRRTFPGLLVAPFVTSPSWNLFAVPPVSDVRLMPG